MSCATWEPKSRMRMRSMAEIPDSVDVIVGRLFGDLHVVDVGLAHSRGGDLDEFRAGAHILDGAATGVAHARAKTAHQLADDRRRRSLVGDAALDTFGHELVGIHL